LHCYEEVVEATNLIRRKDLFSPVLEDEHQNSKMKVLVLLRGLWHMMDGNGRSIYQGKQSHHDGRGVCMYVFMYIAKQKARDRDWCLTTPLEVEHIHNDLKLHLLMVPPLPSTALEGPSI
jgi:hypothetical protein